MGSGSVIKMAGLNRALKQACVYLSDIGHFKSKADLLDYWLNDIQTQALCCVQHEDYLHLCSQQTIKWAEMMAF